VNIDNERAMPAAELAALAKSLGLRAEAATLDAARARLPELAREYGFGCVAGSVYLAGAWMAGETDAGERF
jgi:hypothetical protein